MICFVLFLIVPIALLLWYKRADADLTLLWKHFSGQDELSKYKDQVVWITGASSGIGEEIAYSFASLGARLILSGTRIEALMKVQERCLDKGSPKAICVPFDVAEHWSHEELHNQIIAEFGEINLLVNNAGRLQRSEFTATNVDAEKELFNVNVFGIISLCRVTVRHWLRTGQANAQLYVTSSAAGKMGSPFSSSYAGSKHALHGYLETLRDELSCSGSDIRITIANPGPVRSNLRANALTDKIGKKYNRDDSTSQRKLMETKRCAELIVSGIAHGLDELWIADQPLLLLFYVYQYFPSIFRRYLINYVMTKKQIEKFRKGE
ncbi:dehydrogenase/reductase SDR family member 7 [Galendromus occidentalis]|uniref:Dehydrogenase/reductase SDR family member 7 n=1 Tax=Galendromus occidentalis TaxID=34638 RepID=A0AAJ6QPZ3_9ACAR|nr:dehydrogenase/reductase SDR family member 7 [Galendromus occidentalis]